MCGRYTLVRLEHVPEVLPFLDGALPETRPRYNIAPSQAVAVVANGPRPHVELFRWGLVPSWAKEESIGNRMVNARAESLAEKRAFRAAIRRRRCLILADGFFEWQLQTDGKTKVPMYVTMKDGRPFCFAGLWDVWRHAGQELKSCTIITTAANELMKPIHDRMPAIVPPKGYLDWLDASEREPQSLQDWLQPFPAGEMAARPVGSLVNNPRNDAPDVLAPAKVPEARPPQGTQETLF